MISFNMEKKQNIKMLLQLAKYLQLFCNIQQIILKNSSLSNDTQSRQNNVQCGKIEKETKSINTNVSH